MAIARRSVPVLSVRRHRGLCQCRHVRAAAQLDTPAGAASALPRRPRAGRGRRAGASANTSTSAASMAGVGDARCRRTWQPLFDAQPVQSIGAPPRRRPIRVSSASALARPTCAATFPRARACSGPATAATHWQAAGPPTASRSHASASIRATPGACWRRRSATPLRGQRRARRLPQHRRARTGARCWGRTPTPVRWTYAFEPGNPPWSTPPSGRRGARLEYVPAFQRSGSGVYQSRDGGEHWRAITRRRPAGATRSRRLRAVAGAPQRVYAIVDAEPGGGLYRSDDAGAHWRLMSGDPRLWQRGWYFGEIAADPTMPIESTCSTPSCCAATTAARISRRSGRHHRRRLPRAVDRPQRYAAADPRRGPGRHRYPERRRKLELLVQPAHRPVLSRQHRQPFPVLGLRCAGIPALLAAAAPRTATASTSPTSAEVTAGGERQHRARIPPIRTSSTAAASTPRPAHAPDALRRSHPWPIPTTIAAPGPRSPSPCATRCCISPTSSFCTAAPTTVSTGTSSARTSRAKTRHAEDARRTHRRAAPADGTAPRRDLRHCALACADHDLWVGTDDGKGRRTRDEGAPGRT